MNKKGSTLTNWIFVILILSLFLVLFQTQVIDEMNRIYGMNHTTGLSTDAMNNINSVSGKVSVGKGEIDNAEVSRTSDGLTLVAVGSITKGIFQTIGDFASGRFLSSLLTDNLDFPPLVAQVLTIMIWISLIFIMIRIFMRGVTP